MDVISVHVPKTAGSSFQDLLVRIYGEDRVLMDYQDLPMNPISRYHVDREGWRGSADAEVRAIGPQYRAIHGHFPIEKYAGAFPEARRIAWVRHPASWVISLYFFWKNIPTTTHPLVRRLHAGGLSLDEFAEDPSVRNRVSRVFLRGVPLESFAFLGVQEHFGADFADLARAMGWPEPGPSFENRNVEPGYAERIRELRQDARLVDRLISLNEEDMALYEAAVALRARRLAQARDRAERHARRSALREAVAQDRRSGRTETA